MDQILHVTASETSKKTQTNRSEFPISDFFVAQVASY